MLSFVQLVHLPIQPGKPQSSSTLAFDEIRQRLWVASPDNQSVSVVDATKGITWQVRAADSVSKLTALGSALAQLQIEEL